MAQPEYQTSTSPEYQKKPSRMVLSVDAHCSTKDDIVYISQLATSTAGWPWQPADYQLKARHAAIARNAQCVGSQGAVGSSDRCQPHGHGTLISVRNARGAWEAL